MTTADIERAMRGEKAPLQPMYDPMSNFDPEAEGIKTIRGVKKDENFEESVGSLGLNFHNDISKKDEGGDGIGFPPNGVKDFKDGGGGY